MNSVAFIGAGVASVTAIEDLRNGGYDGHITLFSDEQWLPYDRPPLSKEVLLGAEPNGVPLRPESFYSTNAVELVLGQPIRKIGVTERVLTTAQGHHHRTDTLVLATGGSARRLPLPGAELVGVHVLRTHDDAIALGQELVAGARVAVIGGGFIGTEVAAAGITRGAEVILLEAAPAPLETVLPELAPLVVERHRQRGVTIRTRVAIDGFTGTTRVTGVQLAGGETVPADLVVVGVGMRPNDQLATDAGLPTGNGVHVDHHMRTAAPKVFAIGDVANIGDDTARRRSEHWSHAVNTGRRLADTLLGRPAQPAAVPWFWSDQYDLNIQMVGTPDPADERIWREDPGRDRLTVLFHRQGQLTGAVTLNNGRDIRPVSDIITAGLNLPAAALAASETDLRKLAKQALREAALSARH